MCSNSRVAVRRECAPGWFETSGLHAVMLQDIEPESSSCPEKLISPVRGRRAVIASIPWPHYPHLSEAFGSLLRFDDQLEHSRFVVYPPAD